MIFSFFHTVPLDKNGPDCTDHRPQSDVVNIRVFALQISHFKIPRALDFFLGNSRNLRQLFEISARFGKSKQEISNFPSHSRIIWGVKLRKIEINLERKHSIVNCETVRLECYTATLLRYHTAAMEQWTL